MFKWGVIKLCVAIELKLGLHWYCDILGSISILDFNSHGILEAGLMR